MKRLVFKVSVLFFLIVTSLSKDWSAVIVPERLMNAPAEVRTTLITGIVLIFIARIMRKLKGGLHSLHTGILKFQHSLNPLHIYCRLVECRLNKKVVLPVCALYEILLYAWISRLSVRLDTSLERALRQ